QGADEFLLVRSDPGEPFVHGHPVDARCPLVRLDPLIGSIQVVSVAHLLHETFGQGSCWVGRRGPLQLPEHPRSGAAFAGGVVAQTLLELLKEESLVRPALRSLWAHRVVPDWLLGKKGSGPSPLLRGMVGPPPRGGRPGDERFTTASADFSTPVPTRC